MDDKTYVKKDIFQIPGLQYVYIEQCLQKQLLPFLRDHTGPVLFWPDLASCHYAKKIIKWYKENDVKLVAKTANPPNCPELRPIENYWALVKQPISKECGYLLQIKPRNMLCKI